MSMSVRPPVPSPSNQICTCPAEAPDVGSVRVAPLGKIPLAVTFRVETEGAPTASPGRNETKPPTLGFTAVTFTTTPDAPTGTTVAVPVVVAMLPVTVSNTGVASAMSAAPTSVRVSRTRVGVTGT